MFIVDQQTPDMGVLLGNRPKHAASRMPNTHVRSRRLQYAPALHLMCAVHTEAQWKSGIQGCLLACKNTLSCTGRRDSTLHQQGKRRLSKALPRVPGKVEVPLAGMNSVIQP